MNVHDLGCLERPDILGRIYEALPAALATLATVVGLSLIGAFLNRSSRFRAYDIFSGWGFVAAGMTLTSVFFRGGLPFSTMAVFVLAALAVIPALNRRYFISPFWLLTLFPGLFIIVAIDIAGVAKWDDFSQWVPNALYIFANDGPPGHGLPPTHSVWPGYPYALPFLTYMASWLANGFVVQGGAMINFLLLVAFAAMMAELPEPLATTSISLRSVAKMALAIAIVTIGNPAFNASFSITSQGDTPTMVLTGAIGLLLWQLIDAVSQKTRYRILTLVVPIALIGTALVLVKQSNMVLLLLLIASFVAVAARNGALKAAVMQVPILLLPALAIRLAWQHYVNTEMDGNGFILHPLSAWRFDLIGPLLHATSAEMIKKNGLTLLMVGVSLYGASSLCRPPTPLRNFALLTGLVFLGYFAFLLAMYLGASFTENEIRRAASLYRYTTHVGLLGLSTLWIAFPRFWEVIKHRIPPVSRPIKWIAVAALIFLLPIVELVKGDIIVPQPTPVACHIRAFGQTLAAVLPDHSRLAILEPEGNGEFAFMINFELDLQGAQIGKTMNVVSPTGSFDLPFDTTALQQYVQSLANNSDVTTILVAKAEHVPLLFEGYDNREAPLVLERQGNSWKKITP